MTNSDLINNKVEFTAAGLQTLTELCDFLPFEERSGAVVGLLYSIGWF